MEEEVDYDENEDEENGSSIDAGAAFDEHFNCHKCFLMWRTHSKTVSALARGSSFAQDCLWVSEGDARAEELYGDLFARDGAGEGLLPIQAAEASLTLSMAVHACP